MKPLPAFALAAVGGGLAAWVVFYFAQKKLEASFAAGQASVQQQLAAGSSSLTSQLSAGEAQAAQTVLALVNAQVGPQVDSAVISTLASYGITPAVGQKVASIVSALP